MDPWNRLIARAEAIRGLQEGFWEGLFGAAFQLASLVVVGLFANGIFRWYRDRSEMRRELIDEIDEFSIRLFSPRKLYQAWVQAHPPGVPMRPSMATALIPASKETPDKCYEALLEAIGRFRAVQVKLLPLFGHDLGLFALYVAIWNRLKEIRTRIERHESLLHEGEAPGGRDAFLRLLDEFRYQVATHRAVW